MFIKKLLFLKNNKKKIHVRLLKCYAWPGGTFTSQQKLRRDRQYMNC